MDWDRAIERNREALKRVLASLLAMTGLGAAPSSPLVGEDGPARRGKAEALAGPGEGSLSGRRPILPRHLHRAVLRLLRPAEAAVRRLVIVAARGVVVPPPAPPRPRKPDPKGGHAALRALGIAVVMSPADHARASAGKSRRPHPEVRGKAEPRRTPVRKVTLPMVDPICIPRPNRPRYVPAHAAPRILSFDGARPHRLPPPPSPDDVIDASRLALRLTALASALDNLPREARRFARWRARRDAARARQAATPVPPLRSGGGGPPKAVEGARNRAARRLSPLRPGRPPGLSAANRRRPAHEVHEILSDLQWFAFKALESPDTS